MKRITSEKYFHVEPENFNCAQSILKGFQNEFNISDDEIETFRAYGGGRAENGICGALYAANFLMHRIGKNSLNEFFKNEISYEKCLDIKRNKCSSCEECVKLADRLISKECGS